MKRREQGSKPRTHARQSTTAVATPDAIGEPESCTTAHPRRSVIGRPRALTSAQIAAILAWHDSRVTLKELAASLGVSTSTVTHVIATRGAHYKQAPPENRAENLRTHRAHRQALRNAHLL